MSNINTNAKPFLKWAGEEKIGRKVFLFSIDNGVEFREIVTDTDHSEAIIDGNEFGITHLMGMIYQLELSEWATEIGPFAYYMSEDLYALKSFVASLFSSME